MTLATKVLDREKVPFTLHEYEHDPHAEAFGLETAEKLGVDAERVFKTLVAVADGKMVFGIVPAPSRLSLKSLARAAGAKKAELARPEDAERVTGYVLGGISPLGGKKALPTFLDETAILHETIFVSAGARGMQIQLAPDQLIRLTRATLADITE
jgi:Cys-tRNA(Pro)/Cys-tRNA(Cys) deacylase